MGEGESPKLQESGSVAWRRNFNSQADEDLRLRETADCLSELMSDEILTQDFLIHSAVS